MAKSDVTQLEALVAQGRLGEALMGYERLLATRPDDGVLRTRVLMLREAVGDAPSTSGAWARVEDPPAPPPPPRLPFSVTPEDVVDGYIAAGRVQDAFALLEDLRAQRPQDRGILQRIDRVKKLLPAAEPAPQKAPTAREPRPAALAAPPPPAPRAPETPTPQPPAAELRPAEPRAAERAPFGSPRSTPGAAPFGTPRSVSGVGAPPSAFGKPRTNSSTGPAPQPSAFHAQPARTAAPQAPRTATAPARPSNARPARQDTAPRTHTTPVITDDSQPMVPEERTQLSMAPPEVTDPYRGAAPQHAPSPPEPTMVAAPSRYQMAVTRGALPEPGFRGRRSDTRPDAPAVERENSTTDSHSISVALRGSDTRPVPTDTILAEPPSGLREAIAERTDETVRPVIHHEERTAFGPPPDMPPAQRESEPVVLSRRKPRR